MFIEMLILFRKWAALKRKFPDFPDSLPKFPGFSPTFSGLTQFPDFSLTSLTWQTSCVRTSPHLELSYLWLHVIVWCLQLNQFNLQFGQPLLNLVLNLRETVVHCTLRAKIIPTTSYPGLDAVHLARQVGAGVTHTFGVWTWTCLCQMITCFVQPLKRFLCGQEVLFILLKWKQTN